MFIYIEQSYALTTGGPVQSDQIVVDRRAHPLHEEKRRSVFFTNNQPKQHELREPHELDRGRTPDGELRSGDLRARIRQHKPRRAWGAARNEDARHERSSS